MTNLYSLDVEKHFLACLLQYPDIWPEVSIIDEKDFSTFNSVIFQVMLLELNANKPLSAILLAEKIKSYSVVTDVDPYDYLEALKLLPIKKSEGASLAKQLKKLTVLRDFESIGKKIQRASKELIEKPFVEIVSQMDTIYNEKINLYSGGQDDPQDLFQNVKENIEKMGNNPRDDGIIVPSFPKYTDFFGSFTPGDEYVFAARAKAGKSTLLMNLVFDACNAPENGECRALYLDTELETYRVQRRIVSALSGVSTWWLRTGFWRQNAELEKKVRAALANSQKYFNKIDHIYVGGKPFDEVISIIKRWHHKHISRFGGKKKAIICFDYIKLGEENPTLAIKDYVIVGRKVERLKQIATELQCPVITSCQTNRTNEGRRDSSKIVDDGSAVGLSDQINQFASSVFLFRKLALDEKIEFGDDFSHLLIPLYTRELGRDATGSDLVKYLDEKGKIKYKENFIRIDFNAFHVTERGDFRGWVERQGRVPAAGGVSIEDKTLI